MWATCGTRERGGLPGAEQFPARRRFVRPGRSRAGRRTCSIPDGPGPDSRVGGDLRNRCWPHCSGRVEGGPQAAIDIAFEDRRRLQVVVFQRSILVSMARSRQGRAVWPPRDGSALVAGRLCGPLTGVPIQDAAGGRPFSLSMTAIWAPSGRNARSLALPGPPRRGGRSPFINQELPVPVHSDPSTVRTELGRATLGPDPRATRRRSTSDLAAAGRIVVARSPIGADGENPDVSIAHRGEPAISYSSPMRRTRSFIAEPEGVTGHSPSKANAIMPSGMRMGGPSGFMSGTAIRRWPRRRTDRAAPLYIPAHVRSSPPCQCAPS